MREVLDGLANPNGCPLTMTWFAVRVRDGEEP